MPEPKKFELTPSVSIIIAGVIVAGAIVATHYMPASPAAVAAGGAPAADGALTTKVPAPSASDHIIGSPSAPIVLIEYSDFQCPYCQMIYPTLQKIVSESNGGVAWVLREYPLYQIHPNATPAANAAECMSEQLGNDGYWKFANAVFADQSKLGDTYYKTLAVQFGANSAQFSSCLTSAKYQSKIDQETADAEAAGGNGTPYTVVMNTKTGRQYAVSGALPYAQIMAVINKAK